MANHILNEGYKNSSYLFDKAVDQKFSLKIENL